jgi:hypothetical protein
MESSERVTWDDCPKGRRAVAVGWVNGRLVGVRLSAPLGLSTEQVQAFAAGRVDRRATG